MRWKCNIFPICIVLCRFIVISYSFGTDIDYPDTGPRPGLAALIDYVNTDYEGKRASDAVPITAITTSTSLPIDMHVNTANGTTSTGFVKPVENINKNENANELKMKAEGNGNSSKIYLRENDSHNANISEEGKQVGHNVDAYDYLGYENQPEDLPSLQEKSVFNRTGNENQIGEINAASETKTKPGHNIRKITKNSKALYQQRNNDLVYSKKGTLENGLRTQFDPNNYPYDQLLRQNTYPNNNINSQGNPIVISSNMHPMQNVYGNPNTGIIPAYNPNGYKVQNFPVAYNSNKITQENLQAYKNNIKMNSQAYSYQDQTMNYGLSGQEKSEILGGERSGGTQNQDQRSRSLAIQQQGYGPPAGYYVQMPSLHHDNSVMDGEQSVNTFKKGYGYSTILYNPAAQYPAAQNKNKQVYNQLQYLAPQYQGIQKHNTRTENQNHNPDAQNPNSEKHQENNQNTSPQDREGQTQNPNFQNTEGQTQNLDPQNSERQNRSTDPQNPEEHNSNTNNDIVTQNPNQEPQNQNAGSQDSTQNPDAQNTEQNPESTTAQANPQPQYPEVQDETNAPMNASTAAPGFIDYDDIPGWYDARFSTIPGVTTSLLFGTTDTVLAETTTSALIHASHTLVLEAKREMGNYHWGYFIGFTTKMFQVLASKDPNECFTLLLALKTVIDSMVDGGKLSDLGNTAAQSLKNVATALLGEGTDDMTFRLQSAAALLRERNLALSSDVLPIIDIVDASYTVPEGDKLLESLVEIDEFPQNNLSSIIIATNVVNGLLQPYWRTAGTQNRAKLIEMITIAIESRYKGRRRHNDDIFEKKAISIEKIFQKLSGNTNKEHRIEKDKRLEHWRENNHKKSRNSVDDIKPVTSANRSYLRRITYAEIINNVRTHTSQGQNRRKSTEKSKLTTRKLRTKYNKYDRLRQNEYNYEKTLRNRVLVHTNHEVVNDEFNNNKLRVPKVNTSNIVRSVSEKSLGRKTVTIANKKHITQKKDLGKDFFKKKTTTAKRDMDNVKRIVKEPKRITKNGRGNKPILLAHIKNGTANDIAQRILTTIKNQLTKQTMQKKKLSGNNYNMTQKNIAKSNEIGATHEMTYIDVPKNNIKSHKHKETTKRDQYLVEIIIKEAIGEVIEKSVKKKIATVDKHRDSNQKIVIINNMATINKVRTNNKSRNITHSNITKEVTKKEEAMKVGSEETTDQNFDRSYQDDVESSINKVKNVKKVKNYNSSDEIEYSGPSKYISPIVLKRFNFNNDNKNKNNKETKKIKSTLKNIIEESSYSDEENQLKMVLSDAMRHSHFAFRKTGRNEKDQEDNTMDELSSYSDEEAVLKNNIYRAFGYDPDLDIK